jgi:hypothetical protein
MFQTVTLWRQIALSVVLNWVLGPFVSVIEPIIRRITDQSDHASSRLGYITRSADISRGSHNGRTRQVSPTVTDL